MNQMLRELKDHYKKLQLKKSQVEPEIFQILQHKVEQLPHFTHFLGLDTYILTIYPNNTSK